jgi:hypothetical protein
MTLADVRLGLRAYLLGLSAISTEVGGNRIYPLKMPQGQTSTSIVYSRISGLGDHHSTGPSGLSRPRIQIDCWAQSADAADALSRLVKERIDGFRGAMLWGDNSPEEAIQIQGIFFESEREDYDDTVKMYRSSKDFFVWFEER